jgi:general secretion pathway protein D
MVGLVLILTLTGGGITAADPASQKPKKPLTEEERRKAIQKLIDKMEMQKGKPQKDVKKDPEQTPEQRPPVPSAVDRAPLASGQIQLNFDNADLYSFINNITDTLGITPVIIDPDVKGSVTIHSSEPMSHEDVFPLFNLILKNNNAALVKQGGIYQIVPISSALRKGLELILHLPPVPPEEPVADEAEKKPDPAAAPNPDATAPEQNQSAPQAQAQEPGMPLIPRLITNVIRVEVVPVSDLIEPLKLFMTEGGVIMPYERLNLLIVTDYSDSVEKILEIVHLLDDSLMDPDYIELIEIEYNLSADVAEDLQKVFGTAEGTTGINFVSLDRLNAILVMANSKRALSEVKRWIARFDEKAGRSIQTFVYRVENSTASNIAMIISLLLGGEAPTGGAATGGVGAGGGITGGTSRQGNPQNRQSGFGGNQSPFGNTGRTGSSMFGSGGYGQQGYGGYGGGFGGGFGGGLGGFGGGYGGYGGFGAGSQLGPRLNQGPLMSAQILRGGVFSGLQDIVRIVADDINNSLIVQSTPADYAYIEEIIKEMDVLPRQVVIDARIFEVDLTDALSFGISAELQKRAGEERVTTASIDGNTGALSAATFAFIGNQRELLMALSALRAKTNVRVLEAPSVLALDGTAAKVVVGGEVPYPGASYVPPTGGSTTSIQYRETGIALIIIPRISASGTVTLEIAHEVSAPGPPANEGPTFNKTSVSTTLAVKDGKTVAIAGLIREADTRSRSGVPYLSDIPLLGYLFGKTTRSSNRSELLILITPHVIRTPERFEEMTQDIKDSLRNVRKFVDGFEREQVQDLEDARRERAEKGITEKPETEKKEEPSKKEESKKQKPKKK